MNYEIGQRIRVYTQEPFSVSGVATDPTDINLQIRKPDGTITIYDYALGEIIRDGAGNYHKDIDIDMDGSWYYRWVGTGTVVAANENWFLVNPSQFI